MVTPGFRVVTIKLLTVQGLPASQAYDITALVDGLSFSSTDKGGDEQATFTVLRDWATQAPEIATGNILRVTAGVDVLFQGRITENDREVSDAQQIGVTALGLGVRLKDKENVRLLIVDRDLSQWRGAGLAEQARLLASSFQISTSEVAADTASHNPSLVFKITDNWASPYKPLVESWYDAGPGLKVGSIYHNWASSGTALDANFLLEGYATDTDDGASTIDTFMTDRIAGAALSSPTSYQTLSTARRYILFELLYGTTPAGTAGATWLLANRNPAVYGTHGLTLRGGSDPGGFYASDIVTYVAGLVSTITARRVDSSSSFVIPQAAWRDPTTHGDIIADVTKYHDVAWGVWGPSSVFDLSTQGYLDWTLPDRTVQTWSVARADCDNIGVNVETSTLYDSVDVSYVDAAGVQGVETRTTTTTELTESRAHSLNGGTLTQSGAQQLGDAFLALTAGYAPARGTVTLSGKVSHYQRGRLPAYLIRPDGANLRLQDVLPTKDALSLSSAPDRRSTLPIRKVTVDLSGSTAKTQLDVDQTSDRLSELQAQLQVAARATAGQG